MKYLVFAYKDAKRGFSGPIIDINEDAAIRGFGLQVNQPGNEMDLYANDFDLYKIGEYDSQNGIITALDPIWIANGKSVKLP